MKSMQQEWSAFWKKLAHLSEAGVPILAAVDALAKESTPSAIRETCHVLIAKIKDGQTVCDALVQLPNSFSPAMIKIIQVGEITGKLPESMRRLATAIEEGLFPPDSMESAGNDTAAPELTPLKATPTDKEHPIIHCVSDILRTAYERKASAIHIETTPDAIRIRCRVDGILQDMESPPPQLSAALTTRFKIMAGLNVSEKRVPQDGRAHITIAHQPLDLRISAIPIVSGESIVIRFLTQTVDVPTLDRIFQKDHLDTIRQWWKHPPCLIVVSGPNGSGKTTTLYAMLKSFDAVHAKIMTVEHPVEFRLEGVCQQTINPALGLTFPAALRSVQRQEPDVILAGDLRDPETASLLTEMSMAGIRVFTALRAAGSVETIRQLVETGLDPHVIGSARVGVIAQRLVRLICAHCKTETPTEAWMRDLFPRGVTPKLFKGRGCDHCHGTGYSGRIAIHELFQPTGEWLHKLTPETPIEVLRASAIQNGLVTLRAGGLAKVAEGLTTLDEILAVTPPDPR